MIKTKHSLVMCEGARLERSLIITFYNLYTCKQVIYIVLQGQHNRYTNKKSKSARDVDKLSHCRLLTPHKKKVITYFANLETLSQNGSSRRDLLLLFFLIFTFFVFFSYYYHYFIQEVQVMEF